MSEKWDEDVVGGSEEDWGRVEAAVDGEDVVGGEEGKVGGVEVWSDVALTANDVT